MPETTVVTLLFTDLVGSTELSQRLGEERAEDVRRKHTEALREAVSSNQGREVKHLGDGIMVVFGSPSAAASCAVAMQVAVHQQSHEQPLGLRIGLHTGEVTKEDDDYFGTAVIAAERLCKRCDGGQIFVSDVVRSLVGSRGGHVFKEIGPLELKGLTEPLHAFELGWEPMPDTDLIAQGRWTDAYAKLADATEPEDIERFALASYMTGRDETTADAWTRAHHAWLERGDVQKAARCGLRLANIHLTRGEMAQAMGWIARAGRMIEGEDCAEQAWVLNLSALPVMFGGDAATAYEQFVRAAEIATRLGDAEGLFLTRLARGQCLVMMGRVSEGVSMLDEVMVSVTSGEVYPVMTGIAYCAVIETCHRLFDVRRAREWTDALTRWTEAQQGLVPFRGNCLIHRCEIMQVQGAWQGALDAAQGACSRLSGPPPMGPLGAAYYQMAEVRRLRGELDEAEEGYRVASEAGHEPEPGMSLLRLARGRTDAAVSAIRRVLDETDDPMGRARVLPAFVEIMLAAGDVDSARTASDELESIASLHAAPYLRALSAHASGAVLLASDDARAALGTLRAASAAWRELDAPREEARARLLIGVACRALGDEDTASMEMSAAASVFKRLGAAPDLSIATRLSAQPSGGPGGLTPREIEVLRLAAAGKTNRAIASELVLSEKTVARHMSNIFTKLGIQSRSAATAWAYENGLVST